jgi:two-component system sensor histidine kinase YesM
MLIRDFLRFPKSIFGKLVVSNLLLIFSMSLIGFLSFLTAKNLIYAYITKSNLNTLTQIQKNINVLIDQTITVVSLFDHNSQLENYLTDSNLDPFNRLKNTDLVEAQIRKYSFAYDWLMYETILLGTNGVVYSPEGEPNFNANFIRRADWYARAVQTPQQISWYGAHPSFVNRNHQVFTAIKTLHNQFSRKYYGTLLLSINEACLYNIYRDSLADQNIVLIHDSSGKIISHSRRQLVGTRVNFRLFPQLSARYIDNHPIIKIGPLKYLCIYQKIEKVNWTLLNLIPLTTLYKDINDLGVNVFLISLLLIIFSFTLAVIISRKISLPLIQLKKRIRNLPQNTAFVGENPIGDEMIILTREYDHVIAELEKTFNTLIKEQKEKRKAELQALQMQIKPHFLYNTINSIKCLLWAGKTELIEPTVNALVNLLEQTISRKEELISIDEEVKCIHDYLFIQEIRSDHIIRLNIQIPDTLRQCRIPKLLLQPMVENAIFHGFEPKQPAGKMRGTISIYGTTIGNDLQLEILDDGIGMEQTTADRLLTNGTQNETRRFNGIGVKNVLERIQLYFGSRYGLTIHSEPGIGTSIIITLPQIYDQTEPEANNDQTANR